MADKIEKTDAQWRAQLSDEQYEVCRRKGTERPFTGIYNDCKESGMYRCVCCDRPLFASEDKFDSGTGWPSFVRAAEDGSVTLTEDLSHGMRRVEVTCADCDSHLGHVFPDGPGPTGQRYCINSLSLRLDEDS